MIRIVLVDDQKIFRDTLKFLIEKDEDIEVVGCAGDVIEALEICSRVIPDLVLMDIMMEGYNGIEGAGMVKERYPSIKIIMLTTFGDD